MTRVWKDAIPPIKFQLRSGAIITTTLTVTKCSTPKLPISTRNRKKSSLAFRPVDVDDDALPFALMKLVDAEGKSRRVAH